jgi:hypothetical protein
MTAQQPSLKPKLLAVAMNKTTNLSTIHQPRFNWKSFRFEFLFWTLIIISLPSFGFLLLRIITRINLP